MRAVIQRVQQAQVRVNNSSIGEIGQGLLAFIGLGHHDTPDTAEKLIDKLLAYRVFEDEQGKMGLNLKQINGGLLLVSQFTLMANTHKGLRPDFSPAMPPEPARQLFDHCVDYAKQCYDRVACGQFGADMQISLINDGPVTFMLEVN